MDTAIESPASTAIPAAAHAARAHPPARPRRAWWKPVAGVALAVLALGWLGRTLYHGYHYEETEDAYVTGHLYQVSPQLDAQVKEVLVDDNQSVKAGDVLVRLDPLQFDLALQKARAALEQAKAQAGETQAAATQSEAQVAEARAREKQAEAQLAQTAAQRELARLNLVRNEQLFARGGVITQADLDNARSTSQAADAAHAANEANIAAAHSAVGSAQAAQHSAEAQIAAADANVSVAEAAVRDAEREFGQAAITAPADGRVGNKSVEVGNRVVAGQTLLALASPDVWIVANFKETQLTRMHPGQQVELEVDALPGSELHGVIDSIAPASGARFALLPPDNATGNFNKVVQRVPVKITLDSASEKAVSDRLRLGLSVVVNVRVR